jgi:hypothetical protein
MSLLNRADTRGGATWSASLRPPPQPSPYPAEGEDDVPGLTIMNGAAPPTMEALELRVTHQSSLLPIQDTPEGRYPDLPRA